jgi:hypothetical protein
LLITDGRFRKDICKKEAVDPPPFFPGVEQCLEVFP